MGGRGFVWLNLETEALNDPCPTNLNEHLDFIPEDIIALLQELRSYIGVIRWLPTAPSQAMKDRGHQLYDQLTEVLR